MSYAIAIAVIGTFVVIVEMGRRRAHTRRNRRIRPCLIVFPPHVRVRPDVE